MILAAGMSDNVFAMTRYTTIGGLDGSFDGDGHALTSIGGVAGWTHNGSNWDFAMVRYDTNGSLDSGFDSDGIVTTAIGSGDEHGFDVAIESDGEIVVIGSGNNGTNLDFAPKPGGIIWQQVQKQCCVQRL